MPLCVVVVSLAKGKVHPKMKIQSFSTHHYVNGGLGEVFESTKPFWSLRG